MKINIHAIIYNYTTRYWNMWKYRGREYDKWRGFINRKVHWNTRQNEKYLQKYMAWMRDTQ